MKEVAQISMALWLFVIAASFAWTAWRAPSVRLTGAQVSRMAFYGVVGAVGEAVTLLVGGFWHG